MILYLDPTLVFTNEYRKQGHRKVLPNSKTHKMLERIRLCNCVKKDHPFSQKKKGKNKDKQRVDKQICFVKIMRLQNNQDSGKII